MSSKRSRKESHFTVVTYTSRLLSFAVPLPDDAKPLHAAIAMTGKSRAAVLASFYNPEEHVWVVRQFATLDSRNRRVGAELTVSVVVLRDPEDLYVLDISLTRLVDAAAHNDELFALKQRSLTYQAALSGGDSEESLSNRPDAQQVVTLVCSRGGPESRDSGASSQLPSDGFVVCGGGFVSDYPVVSAGPALPETVEESLARLVGLAATAPTPSPRSKAESDVTWRGWQVSCAANAGLGCFVMGLRRRQEPKRRSGKLQASVSSFAQGPDATGLMPSLDSSLVSASLSVSAVEGAYASSQLSVRMGAVGGSYAVALPPPHGSFSVVLPSHVPLFQAARDHFYCI